MDDTPLVAIVDDDPSVRKALGRLCRSNGYSVELFDSSESFLEANVADRTDFLILDVALPGKSGLELQAELSAAEPHCPILFITAFDDDIAREQAIGNGAIEFLGKPLDVDRVLELIEKALSDKS